MQTSSILLVEDNPDDVTLARRAFRKNNFDNEIIVAKDGAEALELLLPADDTDQINPAIVLLDLNLPKVSGLDVLRRLRADERTEMLPVIMLTTSSEDRDVEYSYRLGANSFVRKPVNFDDFQHAARVLAEYWLEINEPPDQSTDN